MFFLFSSQIVCVGGGGEMTVFRVCVALYRLQSTFTSTAHILPFIYSVSLYGGPTKGQAL